MIYLPGDSGQWPTLRNATSAIICHSWNSTEYRFWTFDQDGKRYIVKREGKSDHQGWVGWRKWEGVARHFTKTRVVFTKEETPEPQAITEIFTSASRVMRPRNGQQASHAPSEADSSQSLRNMDRLRANAEKNRVKQVLRAPKRRTTGSLESRSQSSSVFRSHTSLSRRSSRHRSGARQMETPRSSTPVSSTSTKAKYRSTNKRERSASVESIDPPLAMATRGQIRRESTATSTNTLVNQEKAALQVSSAQVLPILRAAANIPT